MKIEWFKSITAKFAALAVTFGLVGGAWAADPVTIQDASGNNISVYEVSSGFYQSGTTYASTDFYITNVNGLKFFRDLVNGETGASYAYFTVTGVTGTYPTTPNGIKSFHSNNMFSGKTVHLLTDLDLAGEQWVTIGFNRAERTITDPDTSASASVGKCTFYGLFDAGIYDGEGNLTGTHVISNLDTSWQYVPEAATLQEKYQLTGLFGQLSGGTTAGVKNLTVRNATVVGRTDVGVIAGRSYNGGAKIENCHVVGNVNVNGTGTYVGGLVGECRASIVNSSVDAEAGSSISGLAYVGGLAGSVFQYNANASVEVSDSMVSQTSVNASYSGVAGVGALVGVTNPSGTYHGNVVISGNEANNVPVSAPNSSASKGGVGTLVGNALYDDGAYAVVADNKVSGTTSATAGGEAVTTKMGDANDNIAVGVNVSFDESGKVTGGIFEVINEEVIASGYVTADNPNTETNVSYPLTIGGPYVAVIYDSDTGKFKKGFKTLADALSGAADGETITLISGPDEVISAKGEVTGNKTIYITGTAKFNWEDGWLFVGRGSNPGDGTLIFTNATIYASQHKYPGSTGFNISGHEKGSATKNDGTIIVVDSYIECNYLSNKGVLKVVGNGTVAQTPNLSIYGGFDVAGRPASETESGEDATASVELSNGAYLQIVHMNGLGVGREGKGVVLVTQGSKLEHTTDEAYINIANKGTLYLDATSQFVGHKMNRGGTIEIDATGVVSGTKIFDLSDTSSLEGDVTVKNLVAPMTAIYDADGDVTLMSVAAIVNDSSDALVGRYETLAEAVEAYQNGYTIVVFDKTQTIPEGWMFKESGNVTTLVKAVAQIGTTKYETVEAALTDAQTSGATIEILADSTETPDHALEVLMGGNITLTSTTPVRVEIAPTAKTSSVDTDGMAYIRSASADARCTFTVGENVTLAFPATAAAAGAMYIGYSAEKAADMVVNGRLELYEPYVGSLSTLTVNPSGSIKSISECLIVRWGATVDIVGTGAEWSDANPQAEFGYVELQGGVTRLKDTYAKGGAWVHLYNRNADKVDQYGATTLALDNSVLATSKINNQVVIAMDCDSQIVTLVVQNTGSINIDATGIAQAIKVVDYTGSGTMTLADYGTVNVTAGEVYVDGNDLWVRKLKVAQVISANGATTNKYESLTEAINNANSGETVMLLADITENFKFIADNSKQNLTIDLGGFTLSGKIETSYNKSIAGLLIKNGTLQGPDANAKCISLSSQVGGITLENVVVRAGNHYRAAAFNANSNAPITLRNCTVYGNTSLNGSGAILSVYDSEIYPGVYASSANPSANASLDATNHSRIDLYSGTFHAYLSTSNNGEAYAHGGLYYVNPSAYVNEGYVAVEGKDAEDVTCWTIGRGPSVAMVTLANGTETEYWTLLDAMTNLEAGCTLTVQPGSYTLPATDAQFGAYHLPNNVTIVGVSDNADRVRITNTNTEQQHNNQKGLILYGSGLVITNTDFVAFDADFNSALVIRGDATVVDCNIIGAQATADVYHTCGMYNCEVNGTLKFVRCSISGDEYALNVGGYSGEVILEDCAVAGWTSFGSVKVTAVDTTFAAGPENNGTRFYSDTFLSNCTFSAQTDIDICYAEKTGIALILSDCSYEGEGTLESIITESANSSSGPASHDIANNYVAVGTNVQLDENGEIVGGLFDVIADELIADGYTAFPVENNKLFVGTVVAKIGDIYYRTFAEAIDAADATLAETGVDPVIEVIDATAEQGNPNWKIDGDKLVRKVYVAQIGTTEYTSLFDAAAAVSDGDTITMIADSVETREVVFAFNGSATLDLNGHTVSANDDIWVKTGNITVVGGAGSAVTSTGYGFYVSTNSKPNNAATLTIDSDNVTVTAGTYGVVVMSGGSFNLVNGHIVSDSEFAVCGHGTATNVTINISGGSILGNGAIGVYFPPAGALNISGGTITGTTAIYQKCGTMTITGGTILGTGTAAEYAYNDSGANATGDAVVLDNCNYQNGVPSATITGGTFISANAQPIASYAGNGETELVLGFVSGGYLSSVISVACCASDYLCTTRPVLDELYQVVPAATVTYTLGGNDPDGAALPSPASFAYPSGDMAEIALAVATCTDENSTFAGWKIGGAGDAISSLPAGTTDDITLVASWTQVKAVTVDAGESKTPTIKVTEEWITQNVTNKVGETATTAEIQTALNETEANGNKAWENYVLGLNGSDPNAKVAANAAQGPVSATPITSNVRATAVDTGFKVEYRLDKVDASGNVEEAGAAQSTPDLTADIAEMTADTNVVYYKTAAVITSVDGSVTNTVSSTNTVGVLKVTSNAKTTPVAVPWESLGGGDISVSNIVRTASLTPAGGDYDGDELKAYDPETGKYKAWRLSADRTWVPAPVVGGSGETGADAYTVKRGSAVWLTRKNTDTPIYLVGGVAATEKAEVKLEAGTTTNPSWNLVGSASTEPVEVTALLGENHSDKVSVPTATVPKNYEYNSTLGKWGYRDSETYLHTNKANRVSIRVRDVFVTDDNYIPAGTGFWYQNAGEDKNINL